MIAEIAIAFTGFAGIFGALAGNKLRPDHPAVWLPFWATIELGLMMVFAALFPVLPHLFGAADGLTWALSSGVLSLFVVGHFLFMWPRYLSASRAGLLIRSNVLDGAQGAASLSALNTQVLNTFGVGLNQDSAGFLLGLYLLLVLSGLNFTYLMYVLVLPDPQSTQQGAGPDAE